MMELAKSKVVFTEDPHGYSLDGKMLCGITGLIHDTLQLGVYGDTSDFVVNVAVPRAAERGTSVHHAIENYDRYGIKILLYPKSPRFAEDAGDNYWDVSAELDNYIKHREGFTPVANEYTVSDNLSYASNIDNIWRNDISGEIWLVDTKTNNIKYYPGGEAMLREYLSWQLSIYAFLFERQNPGIKADKLACNWLRGEESAFWEIERKPDDDVSLLLSTRWEFVGGRFAFDDGPGKEIRAKYYQKPAVKEDDQVIAQNVVDNIAELLRVREEVEEKFTDLKKELRMAMEKAGVKSWDSPKFRATIAADTEADSFDVQRFKEDHPELYESYLKKTARKGGFTIKLKTQKTNG